MYKCLISYFPLNSDYQLSFVILGGWAVSSQICHFFFSIVVVKFSGIFVNFNSWRLFKCFNPVGTFNLLQHLISSSLSFCIALSSTYSSSRDSSFQSFKTRSSGKPFPKQTISFRLKEPRWKQSDLSLGRLPKVGIGSSISPKADKVRSDRQK